MQKTIQILLAALLFPLSVLAQSSRTIYVDEAGKLAEQISEDDKYTIEELIVAGELNGTDFRLLRDMAGNNWEGNLTGGRLSKLDLSGVTIVAGGENYLETHNLQVMEGFTVVDDDGFALTTEDNVLPEWGFVGCQSLTTIVCPKNATAIGDYAFYNGNMLSVTLGGQLQTIGVDAFYHNINLAEIMLPTSLTTIGKEAFQYCSSLTTIYSCVAVPMPISDKTFYTYDKATLYVPVGSLSAYKATDGWKKFQQIKESEKASGVTAPSAAADARRAVY